MNIKRNSNVNSDSPVKEYHISDTPGRKHDVTIIDIVHRVEDCLLD
jgi:hypothetical protein